MPIGAFLTDRKVEECLLPVDPLICNRVGSWLQPFPREAANSPCLPYYSFHTCLESRHIRAISHCQTWLKLACGFKSKQTHGYMYRKE